MSRKKIVMLALSVSLVTGAVLTGGCAGNQTAPPETAGQIIENVSPQEALNLIQENQNNPDFVILDVRTAEEVADGHIEEAINIDFYSETFRDEVNRLDKNRTYLIYCRSGRRSGNALDIMAELNFREVYNISDGIIAWEAAGLPTVK